MKRAHSDDDVQIVEDSSLESHCRSDDDENGSAKTPRDEIQEPGPTVVQSEETTGGLCDAVPAAKSAETANGSAPGLRCEDNDASKDTTKIPEKETNDVEKPSEKKLEMLLETISSDDNMTTASESEEDGALGSDEHFNKYTDDIVAKDFVPSLFQATPLRSIQDPSLTLFEFIHRKFGDDSKCEEVAELVDCLEYLHSKSMEINEKWVNTGERTVLILPKTLCHILNNPEHCHKLFSLVNIMLDFGCASKEHVSMSTLIIRHLKISLQLIEALCHYNEDLSEHLIKHHQIHNKLINLFFIDHMCLSLKLNILRALDSSLNGSEPIRLFLYTEVFDDLNGYQTLLKILSMHQRPRVCFSITSILRKIHFYELLQKLNSNANILDSDTELLLADCVEEIKTTFIKAPILMGCPKRFLQARAQFELTPALTQYDVYPTIYRLFDDSSFIDCFSKLLDNPNINGSLEQNILKLLQSLADCDHGLRYLCCRHKEINKLIKVLNKINCQFKLSFIYKVKVLNLVDYLSYFWECNLMHNFKLDPMESVDILHDMFLLSQCVTGKSAVVSVLTMGDNLDTILNFFKYMEQSKSKPNELHMQYAFDLLKIVLENSEDVSYLKKYGTSIYEFGQNKFFNSLVDWTLPAMKHSNFFHDDVGELCTMVKNNIDNCLNFNETLITSLRILKYLGVPNDETAFEGVEDFVELKHKYIILQMYSYDMLGNLLTIIDKLSDTYKQPSVNVWKLTGNKAKNLMSIIRPSIVLIRCMVTLLIQSRGDAFKDLSPVKVLLKLYNLVQHVPESSVIREDATKVTKDIIKTLETYAEIKSGSSMLKEVIAWTLSCPSVFFPGLLLLSKILPSVISKPTTKPLEESVVATMVSFHDSWTDHLAAVNDDLVELITVLGSSRLLKQPLKCVCARIAEFSVSTCTLVAQSLLDALTNVENDDCFGRYLDLLTGLCDNSESGSVKIAVLQILDEEKSQEKYEKFVHKLCENLKANERRHSTILFVRCLCDSNIGGGSSDGSLPKECVPSKRFYNNILSALLTPVESPQTPQVSVLRTVLETCAVIVNNDYGLYQFITVLDAFPRLFHNVLDGLLRNWDAENVRCCTDTLTLAVRLLRQLCARNDGGGTINASRLRNYLDIRTDGGGGGGKDHPLSLLKEVLGDRDPVSCGYLADLSESLNGDDRDDPSVDPIEPQLVAMDSLNVAFRDRLFGVVNANNDGTNGRFTADFADEDSTYECNVEEAASDLTDFDLKDGINDLFKVKDCAVPKPEPIAHKQHEPIIITDKKEKENNIAATSVITTAPIRHKVFSRLGAIQRPDAFRNRLPNTSRPPSLHVDDFVALETRSARRPRYKLPLPALPIQPIQDLNIRLRERQMAYENTYSLFSPYKSHLSLHNWHTRVNALAQMRADYRQTINGRHLELQRHSLLAEWRQLTAEAELRKKRAYSRR